MIRQLDFGDRDLIEKNPSRGASALRIKALFKTYGMGRSFITFCGNETGEILLCVQDNFAVAYLKNESHVEEVSSYLNLTANSVLSEIPLDLAAFRLEVGNTYCLDRWEEMRLENVSNELQTGYNLLSKVFTNSINSTTYTRWYTDLSHRVRHEMSKIHTYNGVCSGTVYLCDNGTVMIAQLGTIEQARGQGLAKKMLYHIATVTENTRELLLLSQDKSSDSFYEKIGFTKQANWYYYTR